MQVQIFYCYISDGHLSRAHKIIRALQDPVVHRTDNAIHWINCYLVGKYVLTQQTMLSAG